MLNMTEFIDMISDKIPNLELKKDVPMSRLTSFRIGGPVDCAAYPKTEAELSDLLKLCAEACPFGLVIENDNAPASKCIACGICVKACPMEVLEIVEK